MFASQLSGLKLRLSNTGFGVSEKTTILTAGAGTATGKGHCAEERSSDQQPDDAVGHSGSSPLPARAP